VSPNVGIKPLNWVPKPVLNSAAAFIAFIALRSRFRHFARRFLNHTWNKDKIRLGKQFVDHLFFEDESPVVDLDFVSVFNLWA
jgi:hypothetical protein